MSIGYSEDDYKGSYEQTPRWIRLLGMEESSQALQDAVLNELFPEPPSSDTSFLRDPHKIYMSIREFVKSAKKGLNSQDQDQNYAAALSLSAATSFLKSPGVIDTLGKDGQIFLIWNLICEMPKSYQMGVLDEEHIQVALIKYGVRERTIQLAIAAPPKAAPRAAKSSVNPAALIIVTNATPEYGGPSPASN